MPRARIQIGGPYATGSAWSNTFEFALSSAVPDLTTLQTIANAVQANLSANAAFKGSISSDATCVAPKILHYASNTGPADLVAQGAGASFVGGVAAVHAPQVCVVASLRTGSAGRSRRGRLYWPHRGSLINSSGVVSSSGQSNVGNGVLGARQAISAAFASSGITCQWVVWSPKLGSAAPITSVLVGGQCDTIRHRNRNRSEVYASFTPPAIALAPQDLAEQDLFDLVANAKVTPLDEVLAKKGSFWSELYNVLPLPG